MYINLSKLQEIEKDREAWHAAGGRKSWTWLSDWMKTTPVFQVYNSYMWLPYQSARIWKPSILMEMSISALLDGGFLVGEMRKMNQMISKLPPDSKLK